MKINYYGKRLKNEKDYWNLTNRTKWYFVSLSVLFFLVFVTPKTFTIDNSEAAVVIQKPLAVLVEDLKKEPEPNPDIKEKLDMYIEIYGLQDKKEALYYTIEGESDWCVNMTGDFDSKGKPHAFGCWMIWPEFHKEVSKTCANDFSCSTEFVMKKWKAGNYRLWTCARDFYEGKKICNQ